MAFKTLKKMAARLSKYLVALVLLTSACSQTVSPPLKIGINPWVGYDPLLLAGHTLDQTYPSVQIIELMSNSDSVRALRNGLLDGAALTLDEALRLADSGMDIHIVAVLDTSNGADAVIARPDIRTPAQLRGKRIALEQTALGALMLDRVLAAGNLSVEQVETLHVEAAQQADIFNRGLADAVISFEPMKSHLLAQGFNSIFDSRQMPDEVVDVLVVKADIAAERTAGLLKHWVAGLQALNRDPEGAATKLAKSSGLSVEDYLATLHGLQFIPLTESRALLSGAPAGLIEKTSTLVATLQRMELLQRPPNWHALLNDEPARLALQPESAP